MLTFVGFRRTRLNPRIHGAASEFPIAATANLETLEAACSRFAQDGGFARARVFSSAIAVKPWVGYGRLLSHGDSLACRARWRLCVLLLVVCPFVLRCVQPCAVRPDVQANTSAVARD